jgi:hypothetical protein
MPEGKQSGNYKRRIDVPRQEKHATGRLRAWLQAETSGRVCLIPI